MDRLPELGMIVGTLSSSQGLSVVRLEGDAGLHANLSLLALRRATPAKLRSSSLSLPGQRCGAVSALGVGAEGQGAVCLRG